MAVARKRHLRIDPESLRSLDGIQLRRLRRQMGMDLGEFQSWKANQLGEKPPEGTPFSNTAGKPLWLGGTQKGSAFLICGGPSLKELDLSKLSRRGVWTLAINNAGCLYRPDAMLFVDDAEKFHDSLWLDPHVQKFVPSGKSKGLLRHKEGDEFSRLAFDGQEMHVKDMPNVVLYARSPCYDPATFLTDVNVCWGVSKKWHMRTGRTRILNSMIASIALLYRLGFRAVYLVGADFHMDPKQPYAFAQKGDDGKARSNNNCYAIMQAMFSELRPRFEAAGYHVYNTNPRSGLTAFDFVSYDEAIRTATKYIQQDPLDTAGWYERTLGKVKSG